ncbi:roadblock/LC7 domain-containing protein [Streptomyces hainanensis]|uniref:Roadblock/LC7 domain-containing protein n=1 Tax=Streptomyces hainanensis TaxID=402648 RepID=A0A4R4SRV9_9ACTN|nr:roadblock/LC7 domain-containing protein [Streptomyces hainanensis]TDC64513.1 roadblock/LC7 domain-containing protein [Streptomyces hainanensis]
MDWMLRDLAASVPGIRHIVLLSADGLCMAQHGSERESRDSGDRIAAAASGIKSLAQSIAREFPRDDGDIRMVLLELSGGYFYLMSAGERSYLAVTAEGRVDPGLVSQRMRDLVLRIGEHLSSAPRTPEQAAP